VVGSPFALDDAAHQRLLSRIVAELGIEVVIIDPIAPALGRSDENSNNDVSNYMPFLLELRDSGVAIVLSHHSGKSQDSGQRGASRRRDYLDMNIKLEQVATDMDTTAIFEVSFDKVRNERPDPPKWIAELAKNGCHFWQLTSGRAEEDEQFRAVLNYIYEHEGDGKINVSKMAEHLGIERPRLYDGSFRRARAKGYLTPRKEGIHLTPEGVDLVLKWRQ
jgi:hypothetical protein